MGMDQDTADAYEMVSKHITQIAERTTATARGDTAVVITFERGRFDVKITHLHSVKVNSGTKLVPLIQAAEEALSAKIDYEITQLEQVLERMKLAR